MKREKWSSNLGFLLAATGSAVGLGNIWKFPYVAGHNGGAIFILVYLLLVVILGAPILLSEMAIGRHSHKNAIDACSAIQSGWGFVGIAGVIGAIVILSYYCVIGGWVTKYLMDAIFGVQYADTAAAFHSFTAQPLSPVLYHTGFTVLSMIPVMLGVTNGIERVSKFSLPFLVVALAVIAVYAISLPGALAGVKFLFLPDVSHLKTLGDVGRLIVSAMGQVFFSLSLGMGTMITYGSYLDKNANLQKNALLIPLFDFGIALLAGLATMPCVFSFGLEPSAGTGLLFQALPAVFQKMQFGRMIAILFFALVLLAALTSALSLIQSVVAFLTDRFPLGKATATLITVLPVFLLGVCNALSFGVWADKTLLGLTAFDWMVFLSDNVLMPIGGFFLCILVGYVWGIPNLLREVSSEGRYRLHQTRLLRVLLRVTAPLMIVILFVVSLFTYFRS